jgi:NCS1 family nucleobase:cation symporter-1
MQGGTDAAMSPADLTSLWGAVTLGVPTAVVGFELMVAPSLGGLGLSATQLLLAVPLGVVVAVGILWVSARPGSVYGEGTILMLRPAFGVIGSWLYFPVHVAVMLLLASLELRVVGVVLRSALDGIGLTVNVDIGVVLAALLTFAIAQAGTAGVRWWVRRIAFWGGLAVAMWVVWRLASDVDLAAFRLQEPSRWFWLGVDMIAGLAILFFPLVVDTARSVQDENAAPAGVGAGFGVPALLVLMAGGLAAAASPGAVDPAEIIARFGGPAFGVVGGIVLLAWIIGGEVDQPALFLVMPFQALSSLGFTMPRLVGAILGPGIAAVLAIMVGTRDLFGAISFLISILAPILGVFLSDYYLVRRGAYLSRGLYEARGVYRGINVSSILAVLVGFIVFQWASPVGASWWVEAMVSTLPGAPLAQYGIPAVAVSVVVAFAIYGVLGRFTLHEESYVSRIRL